MAGTPGDVRQSGRRALPCTADADARAWQTIHRPHRAPDGRHPSHLRVNLLPRLQRGGHGKRSGWNGCFRGMGMTAGRCGSAFASAS